MNLTPVSFSFITPKGDPVRNTTVEIQLAKAGFDDDITGVIMPRPILALTDENGEVTVPLAASPTLYYATVVDKESEAALSYKFLVPVLDIPGEVRFQDIVIVGTLPNTSYDEAALLVIHDAKANAMAAQVAAMAAAVDAVAAADSVEEFSGVAQTAAASAELAKVAAQLSQTGASNSSSAASAAKTAAETAATTSTTAQTNAGLSANSASASAAAALASKNAAAVSEIAAEVAIPTWSDTPPVSPAENAQWVDSTSGRKYQWIIGSLSSAWVETGAVVAIGSDVAVAAQASAVAAAASASQAAATAVSVGLTGAAVDGTYHLKVTRGDNTVYDAGYVRGERGEAFSVDAIGTNLAGRATYNAQVDGFSYLDSGAGNLYFRQGATAGVWSAAIPFGKGDKGDPGTPGPTDYTLITNRPPLGTAAALNVPASGNAIAGEVVKGSDTRLTDARTPTTHAHPVSALSDATTIGKAVLVAATTAAAKTAIGVGNVNDTADIDKPVSTAQAAALATKEPFTAPGTAVHYRRGDKTWQVLDKTAVGLPNVGNTRQVFDLRGTNAIYIGYVSGVLDLQIDATYMSNNWPINITGNAAYASTAGSAPANGGNANTVSGLGPWNWSNRNHNPVHVWANDGAGNDQFLVSPGNLRVDYANGAGYANNSGQVSGIGGWHYDNRNYNPAYLWSSQGDGQDQFLVQPGNLSVNYANSCDRANSTGYSDNSGNANRANTCGRADVANNADALGGIGVAWWLSVVSDERLKENIAPTTQDSLAKIKAIDFKQYNFRLMEDGYRVDDGQLHKLGPIAQQLQAIDPEWVHDHIPGAGDEWLRPNVYPMLMAAMHAITQLEAEVAALKAKQKR